MSSYLLLRNNQESGPFSIEEMKGMSLKTYDLIWVVGKSAAWRYPGEITELKSFAPPVPDQTAENNKSRFDHSDSSNSKKKDSGINRTDSRIRRQGSSGSVYVNLPAEKKVISQPPALTFPEDTHFISDISNNTGYNFSDFYGKKTTRAVRNSGKLLWVSTVLLLFGAGILTGFFISDRRKYFSTDANHTQNEKMLQPSVLNREKEISPAIIPVIPPAETLNTRPENTDSIRKSGFVLKKSTAVTGKKILKNAANKKDSVVSITIPVSAFNLNDSLARLPLNKNEGLYQKIKAHPENYVNLLTGRYSTGVFGGISSFPVTVTNNSPVMMDLVVVNIDYIQNNQKVFKTESLSFNDLEPGETLTIRAPKSSRGIKITTRIRVVNSRQLDLSYSN